MKIGFDNDRYLAMQSEHIRERIKKFDNKLYLEFGGKLFDDYHASRVLPGFQPDSKLQMLLQLKEQAEIVIVISAEDIISSKVRGDYGITYDLDVLRLIDAFQEMGLYVGSVCVTKYTAAAEVEAFEKRLSSLGIRTFRHYKIPGYPNDVARIVSDEGYGRNEYIETERPLVVITAPGPGSGKMAVCLSQLYHEYKRGVKAGYVKVVLIPVLLGILINWIFGKQIQKISEVLPLISVVSIVMIISGIVSVNAEKILSCGLLVLGVVALHNLCGMGIGLGAAKLLHIEYDKATAIAIEVGMQNSGLAISLATANFAANPLATLPGAIFSVWHNISGSLFAGIRRGGTGTKEACLEVTE